MNRERTSGFVLLVLGIGIKLFKIEKGAQQ